MAIVRSIRDWLPDCPVDDDTPRHGWSSDQCTIGYAMKIKKKKMFKSKHLVFAHFSTKTGDFFGIDGKIPMFCHKYFLKSKM